MNKFFEWLKSIFSVSKNVVTNTANQISHGSGTGNIRSTLDLIVEKNPTINPKAVAAALRFQNHGRITNRDFMMVVDFSLHDKFRRSYLINMKTYEAVKEKVAHGKNSDSNKDDIPDSFSNINGSFQSSLGAVLVGSVFTNPKWKYVRLLTGLEPGLNDNIKKREILLHSTKYVYEADGKASGDTLGCFGYTEEACARWFSKINGILLYAWHPSLEVGEEMPPNRDLHYRADWDHLATAKEWTNVLVDALKSHGQGMLQMKSVRDADRWAPNFGEMTQEQRMQFYVALISSMARFESGFKPSTSYKEGFNDSQGKPVISRGLLQLSQESVNQRAYGGNVAREEYLHDVNINLVCGVKILNHWIVTDGVIATAKLGGGRYWSVLRDKADPKESSKVKIQARVREMCK